MTSFLTNMKAKIVPQPCIDNGAICWRKDRQHSYGESAPRWQSRVSTRQAAKLAQARAIQHLNRLATRQRWPSRHRVPVNMALTHWHSIWTSSCKGEPLLGEANYIKGGIRLHKPDCFLLSGSHYSLLDLFERTQVDIKFSIIDF